jgi:hypothetical protein
MNILDSLLSAATNEDANGNTTSGSEVGRVRR